MSASFVTESLVTQLEFFPAVAVQPKPGECVLIAGWGEKRQHYVWELGGYEVTTAKRRWINSSDNGTLWFEPVMWARLPNPSPEERKEND